MRKKNKLSRFFFPGLIAIALCSLLLARFVDSREVNIHNIQCRSENERFLVSFNANNRSDKHVRATADVTVSKLVGHGKGATTWDPVASKRITFTLSPKQESEIVTTIPRTKLLTNGRVLIKIFQADVQVIKIESSNNALENDSE